MFSPHSPAASFTRLGPWVPASPLVVGVPHAGRDYPASLLAASRLPAAALEALEDRFVDRLAAGLPGLGVTAFVAARPRAWIDLNRDERELDPAMVRPAPPAAGLIASAKVRGGLGLVPRRIAGHGEIYAAPLHGAEVARRIAHDHRPWHAAIAAALAAAHARFGVAVLLDLHSMPPLPGGMGQAPARIVIGDRHGRSSAGFLVEGMRAAAAEAHAAVLNTPYAGGYTLERHGRPAAGIHAIQLEVDRSLYLADDFRTPGPGLTAATRLVTRLCMVLLASLAGQQRPTALAAE